jgi:hypothetical protein
MNNQIITELVYHLNKIDKSIAMDLLKPCINDYILYPRFQQLVLIKYILINNDYFKGNPNFDQLYNDLTSLILNIKNKASESDIYNTIQKYTNLNVDDIIDENSVNEIDEDIIQSEINDMIENWWSKINRTKKIINVANKTTTVNTSNDFQLLTKAQREGINFTTNKNLYTTVGEVYNPGDLELYSNDSDRLQKLNQLIELRNSENDNKMINKEEEKIFNELFIAYNKLYKPLLTEDEQNKLKNFWFNQVVPFSKSNNISLKIKNGDIPSQASKFILIAYFISLYANLTLENIYILCLHAKNNLSLLNYIFNIKHIYNKHNYLPYDNVATIINNIILNITINDNLLNDKIRKHWNKLKHPTVKIDNLIKFISDLQSIDDTEKKNISNKIIMFYNQNKTKIFNIEKFAKKIFEHIKNNKKNITLNMIIENLTYENQHIGQ